MIPAYDHNGTTIYQGDSLSVLRQMEAQSVNCCVTSPPYFGLRDYKVDGQMGREETPALFVRGMVEVFREVRRVLRADGTLWLNLGDSYVGGGGHYPDAPSSATSKSGKYGDALKRGGISATKDMPAKNLLGIPWRVAFALQEDGWYLRCDIIWNKPNPMPESVTDRPTKSHEYIFLLSKSERYFYDAAAIKEQGNPNASGGKIALPHRLTSGTEMVRKTDKQRGHTRRHAGFNDRWDAMSKEEQAECGRNKRSVWTCAIKPFAEAHFATFPPDLIRPCIKAGCPEGGVVLDCFLGSGTTAMVARQECRRSVGIELNPAYIDIARRRLAQGGLFTQDEEAA
jgi:DNA modification methylase